MRKFLPTLIISIIIFAIFVGPLTRIVSAQIDLNNFLSNGDVLVGVETVNEYSQVYYEFNGSKKVITTGPLNSHMPFSRGEYITFVKDIQGAGQIYLYHIPSDSTVQLTFADTNLRPSVDRTGRVAWEKWVSEIQTWQIMFFDGVTISQLTSGDTSVNADIDGSYIVFDRHDKLASLWHTVGYSTSDKQTAELATQIGASEPRIKDRGLEVKDNHRGRNLVFQDIGNVFELGLPALPLLIPTSQPASDTAIPALLLFPTLQDATEEATVTP